MEKIDVVLVVLNREALENTIKKLDLTKVNPIAIITDSERKKIFLLGNKKIPVSSFRKIQRRMVDYKNFTWLISGYLNDSDDLRKLKKFLAANDVPENNIVDFEAFLETLADISQKTWLANVRHVEKYGADFFATGNEIMRDNLNIKLIPDVHEDKNFSRGGANLSDAGQDLQQSYLTAKNIFRHVKRGTVKFVLIGLTPESFICNSSKDLLSCPNNLQYLPLTDSSADDAQKNILKNLTDYDIEDIFSTTPENTDLNFEYLKESFNNNFSAQAIADWKDDLKFWDIDIAEKNIQILKDYIKLCLENDAKPVGVIFPFSTAAKKNYSKNFLDTFREVIHRLEKDYDFVCIDLFDLNLDYDYFRDMTSLNPKGMMIVNSFLSFKLCNLRLIPAESFCNMTYEYLQALSNVAPKDAYNALLECVFEASAQLIRRKDKIKIGFVVYLSAQWSGDELYNFFANDKRFETTVFFCKRVAGKTDNELFHKDFVHGLEQLKEHNLNVFPVENKKATVPPQDVLIFLTPYFIRLPKVFRHSNITAKTLITHIPYSFDIAVRPNSYYNSTIFHTAWKIFFSSVIGRDVYAKHNSVGMPRGLFSGYPRMDIFFDKNSDFKFEWKMAQPNAKKILWTPHWSIGSALNYATFQWNYQFMYDFAKAHPEISWVLKPHPGLFFAAVREKVFPSIKAFEEYLQKWNELPNAMVYTGAYYQAIFATSDGIINDSGSFIAEYQFVDKPMIFLTREGGKFNDLAYKIFEASYLVDGKDLDAIAATIQKVFVEGHDDKVALRKDVFDKYLNYPKFNGMSASEFIYKSIADELKEVSS